MIEMKTQAQLFFNVLSDSDVAAFLDPNNPKCPYHESKYVGNRNAVEEILDIADAAFKTRCRRHRDNKIVCPRLVPKRIALLGPASVGKTTFASIFAKKVLKLPYCETVPEQLTSSERLYELIEAAYAAAGIELVEEEDGRIVLPAGVLFIDEIHLLSGKVQDSLLKVTESNDGQMVLSDKVVDCRNLCIIIATTDKGKLRSAFKTRFRHMTLVRHTTSQLAQIVKINQPTWTDEECLSVARLKPIPREAKDFADSVNLCRGRKNLSVMEAIKIVADREGICDGGVNSTAIRALKLLNRSAGLSRASLCAALNIEADEFENDVLPCLVANDLHPAYIEISNRHEITEDGRKYIEGK